MVQRNISLFNKVVLSDYEITASSYGYDFHQTSFVNIFIKQRKPIQLPIEDNNNFT